MKKIMFNDRYGLTQAVLERRKTMTRRMVPLSLYNQTDWKAIEEGDYVAVVDGDGYYHDIRRCGNYQIGEEVAVAQSYKSINGHLSAMARCIINPYGSPMEHPGWNNKMFVAAGLMYHRIQITDIKVERLQDISEEDCMKEGVFKYEKPPLHHENDMYAPWPPYVKAYKYDYDNLQYRCNARAAFKTLIDRISGKGTWERNPWVFAYSFELIK